MAKQTLNIGTNANDGTGDKLRDAMIKVNENFTEIYTSPGISSDAILISGNEIKAIRSDDDLIFNPAGSGSVSTPALRFNGNNIEGIRSNENINLVPQGTGSVIFGAIKINGTSLSSDDSSTINVNDNLIVDGTTTIEGTALFKSAVTLESTLDVTGNTTLANITATSTAALTGTVTIDNLTFNDNIIASSSNADIRLEPGGTGAVVLTNLTIDSNINITDNIIKTTASNSNLQLSGSGSGTVEVTSGLTTAAITTVGNVGITGTETITGQLDVDYVRIKDNTITTNASNAHLILSGNGSGNVVIDDVDIGGGAIDGTVIGGTTPAAGTFTTITANTSVTIDGVTITDNTVSTNASNANLELTGSGSGGVTISGFTFPTSDGSNGEFLKTDGAGALSWGAAGATLNYSDIADATTTVSSSSTSVMNTFAKSTYRSCKYFISVVDASNTRYEMVEANVTHDGTNAYITTFGSVTSYDTADDGSTLRTPVVFTADINGSDVRVLVTCPNNNSHVFKFQRTAIDV